MRRLLAPLALVVSLGGCLTPSIPIPPPDPSAMAFALGGEPGATTASFTYAANVNYEGAVVYVFNRDRGIGVIETARADGSVGPTAPVRADLGEQLVITFQLDDQSVATCVRLREGTPSATDYCDR